MGASSKNKRNIILSSSKGMSLLNLIVAIGMGSLITYGIMNIISTTQIQQRTIELSNTMETLSQQFQNALRTDQTWTETFAANANMACLTNATACNAAYVGTGYRDDLPAIRIVSGGQTLLSEGDMAFTIRGERCAAAIPTGTQSTQCPIRYKVRFFIDKTQSTTGLTVTIVGKLIFWPGNDSLYRGKYSAFSPTSTTFEKYDFMVSRQITHQVGTTVPTCVQDGVTLYENQSRVFYRTTSVALGNFCEYENRTCTVVNGVAVLTGSFLYQQCVQNCTGFEGPCVCDPSAPKPNYSGVRYYTLTVPNNEWGTGVCAASGTITTPYCAMAYQCL